VSAGRFGPPVRTTQGEAGLGLSWDFIGGKGGDPTLKVYQPLLLRLQNRETPRPSGLHSSTGCSVQHSTCIAWQGQSPLQLQCNRSCSGMCCSTVLPVLAALRCFPRHHLPSDRLQPLLVLGNIGCRRGHLGSDFCVHVDQTMAISYNLRLPPVGQDACCLWQCREASDLVTLCHRKVPSTLGKNQLLACRHLKQSGRIP
jgi:hypothetical protein